MSHPLPAGTGITFRGVLRSAIKAPLLRSPRGGGSAQRDLTTSTRANSTGTDCIGATARAATLNENYPLNLETQTTPQGVERLRTRSATYMPEPRLLTAEQASAYLGYKSDHILKQIPISPVRLAGVDGQSRWDRHQIDRYLDSLAGLPSETAVAPERASIDPVEAELAQLRLRRAH